MKRCALALLWGIACGLIWVYVSTVIQWAVGG